MKKTNLQILCILTILIFLFGCINPPAEEETEYGESPSGSAEVWSGKLTGNAVGSAFCVAGSDSYYVETGTLKLMVPSPGMEAAMNTYKVTEFKGTFSNIETGTEANGVGCAEPPSVSSTVTDTTNVQIRIVQTQIQISSDTVLIPARFSYSGIGAEALNSKAIYLDPTSITDTTITGTWSASVSDSDSVVFVGGEFLLEKEKPNATAQPGEVITALGYKKGKSFQVELHEVEPGKYLAAQPAEAFLKMREAALQDGVELKVTSAWRSNEEQTKLYNERVNPDGTLTEMGKQNGRAAKPGYSNHQSGEALDIKTGLTIKDFREGKSTQVYRWLKENAQKYGFRRTVESEPWHWEWRSDWSKEAWVPN
ncbi:D-alanyl-D-alanine carboxypeptidase family protein [Candidatus Micrarchaeota archaeon]|nr:D-alanyl-D-alanine carboxypeptidase family protein [Candidatus Micrarchaeota archaeon]